MFKNGGQKWLPLVEVSPDQGVPYSTVLRRSLSSFTKSVHSKSYRAPKICDLLSSLWFLLSFPVLIVTCAVRSFRAQIYKHIGSEGIQNCVEFPFPVSLKLLLFHSSISLSPCLCVSHTLPVSWAWSSDSVHGCVCVCVMFFFVCVCVQ